MTIGEASNYSLRPDDDILADIWEAAWQVDAIRSTDMHSLSITVHDGAVVLEGHIAGTFNRWRLETMVRSTPGVNAVQNNLVVDSELDIQVAQALTRDMRTRPLILPVGSYHGWVRLGGTVPSRELRSAAEAVATQVPAVRGVIALPQVTGEGPTPTRRAVQPRVGASVYAEDGQAGVVAQVVINPQSRLVTHMVVSAKITFDTNDVVGFKSASGDFLVPVEAAEVVNDESIILTPQPPSIAAYPHFEASAYPTAPFTWRPPYPYSLSMVRWYRPQAPEAARRPELQPAMAVPAMLNPDALSASLWSSATERRQAAPQHA